MQSLIDLLSFDAATRAFESSVGRGMAIDCSCRIIMSNGIDSVPLGVRGQAMQYDPALDRIRFKLWHLGTALGEYGTLVDGWIKREYAVAAPDRSIDPRVDVAIHIVAVSKDSRLPVDDVTNEFAWRRVGAPIYDILLKVRPSSDGRRSVMTITMTEQSLQLQFVVTFPSGAFATVEDTRKALPS